MTTEPYPEYRLADEVLDEGTALLEASAGTGKTYTITGILLRMLLEDVVPEIERALVVTFTVAAADELKNRLRAGLSRALAVCRGATDPDPFFQGLAHHGAAGATKLRRALDDFDRASVTTIHSFCKQLLDEAAFESDQPFEVEFTVDESPLWHHAAADALRALRRHDGPLLGAVLHDSAIDPDALVQIYRSWQRHPDVRLPRLDADLPDALGALQAALARAAAAWHAGVGERLLTLQWKKHQAPWRGEAATAVTRLADDLGPRPELQLQVLAALAPSQLDTTVMRGRHGLSDDPFHLACEHVRRAMTTVDEVLRTHLLLDLHTRLRSHKREQGLATFDDLLERAHHAVTDPTCEPRVLPALRKKFAVALIDEFQDTDERQYQIVARVFHGRPLFLVGDPKQSIYGFRGADLGTYLQAARTAVQRRTLGRNFRSSEPLVEAVGRLFGRADAFVEPAIRLPAVRAACGPTERLLTGDGDPRAALHFRFVPPTEFVRSGAPADLRPRETRERIAADVTAEIVRLLRGPASLDGRPLLPKHLAVLTRRNEEAMLVQQHLRAAGVVSVIGKAGDIFTTDERTELERLLLAIQRPQDLQLLRAAMATRLWGHDAASLAAVVADDTALEHALSLLERWRQRWLSRGFVAMHEWLLRDLDLEQRLLQRTDGERRLTNLQQLGELLHQAEHDHRLSPEGVLHWLVRQTQQKDEMDYQRRELRLESDADAVQILTMHGSKGLQYEVVFCPFLWDGRAAPVRDTALPLAAAGAPGDARRRFVMQVERDDHDWLRSEADRLAEDVRLAYVALTRARRRCYVHWGPIGWTQGGWTRSALGWLLLPQAVDMQRPDWPERWPKLCKDGADRLLATLQQLATDSAGAIAVTELPAAATFEPTTGLQSPPAPPHPLTTPPHPTEALPRRAAPPSRPHREPLVVHSFTSLVAGGSAGEDAREVQDPDDAVGADGADPADGAAPAEGADPGDGAATTTIAAPTGIFGFARGAEAGQCLHAVLEHADLDAVDASATRELVQRTLRQFGLADPAAHPAPIDPPNVVLDCLRALRAANLGDGGPSLAELCRDARLAEWQFTLPLAAPPDVPALAELFAAEGRAAACEVARDYAERLARLPRQRYAGFLTGFVDLVARHGDRFWVVDWKSNHLGDEPAAYGPTALRAAMQRHDYVLQYHLYVVALHRHLRARLPDYDYDRHFGGVCYVFLRGVVAGTANGLFTARPPRSLIEALDRWTAAGGVR